MKSDSPWVPGSIPFVLNISLSQKGSDAESRTVKRLVRFFSSYTNFFWRSQGSLFGPLILLVTTAESHWSSWLLSIFIEKSGENHLLPQCADDNRLILISWFYTYFKSFQRLCFAVVFKMEKSLMLEARLLAKKPLYEEKVTTFFFLTKMVFFSSNCNWY